MAERGFVVGAHGSSQHQVPDKCHAYFLTFQERKGHFYRHGVDTTHSESLVQPREDRPQELRCASSLECGLHNSIRYPYLYKIIDRDSHSHQSRIIWGRHWRARFSSGSSMTMRSAASWLAEPVGLMAARDQHVTMPRDPKLAESCARLISEPSNRSRPTSQTNKRQKAPTPHSPFVEPPNVQ
jgi:hypothetical protein